MNDMSVSASIDFKVVDSRGCKIKPVNLIMQLIDFGWNPDFNKVMSYLPVNDEDDFDWQAEKYNLQSLLKILNTKEFQGELIGVILVWKDSEIGGSFLIHQDGTLSINMSINRQIIKGAGFETTDVNWYVVRILPSFSKNNQKIASIKYVEY